MILCGLKYEFIVKDIPINTHNKENCDEINNIYILLKDDISIM